MAKVCLIRPAEGVALSSLSSNQPTLPLGLAYIAASVRAAAHQTQVIDAVGEAIDNIRPWGGVHWVGLSNEEIVGRIRTDTDFIGIGNMFSHNWPMVRELIRAIRIRFPQAPIILGGEHPTSLPQFVLETSATDVCVLGEGEETFLDLLAAYSEKRDLATVAGIAYRDEKGTVHRPPARKRIRAVDDIPWPAWDLFNVPAYRDSSYGNGMQVNDAPPLLPILATRGCPYQCTFCTSPNMWTTAWIARDPKKVVDEIEYYMKTYGARNFPFQDLTAITRKDWILGFCKEILDRKLQFNWQLPSGTRSEAIDDEVAPLLKQTGMYYMGYAPESGSDRIRTAIKKRVKEENFFKSARSALKAKLHVQVFFVIGFPEEEASDLWATLKMIGRLAWMGVQDLGLQYYMPYPGSEMYDKLAAEGLVDTRDEWLLAPLHTHGLIQKKSRVVNKNFGAARLTLTMIGGFALFYLLFYVRRPWAFLKMWTGIFTRPEHDESRLQKALKMLFTTKPRFREGKPRASATSLKGLPQ